MSEVDDNNTVVIDFEQIEQVSKVFFEESKIILDELDGLILGLESAQDPALINNLFRRVHTLKGSAGAVPGGQLLGSLAHEFEALLSKIKKEKKAVTRECIDLFLHSSKLLKMLAQGLREQNEIMPEVLSEVIELINRYGHFELPEDSENFVQKKAPTKTAVAESGEGVWLSHAQFQEMMRISGDVLVLKNHFQMMSLSGDFETRQAEFGQGLFKVSDQLQTQLSKVMKVKADECLKGLSALVRQAATELNKEVVFKNEGFDLLIDKNLGRDLHEVLVHLVRNSIDHGIEDAFDRATQGKSSIGQLQLSLSEKNSFVIAEFRDDGQGLSRERILSKAIEKNLVSATDSAQLSDSQVFDFIFHPGFSTKEKITTISGRGVGMDVVNSIIKKYQGKIHIESTPGQGTCFRMEFALPQNMMMESVILCAWNQLQIAVPLGQVLQIQSVKELQLTDVDQLRYCQWSGQTVPLLNYQEICSGKRLSSVEGEASVIFIRQKENILGLLVEKILGQTDLMVKAFNPLLKRLPGFRGTSVLADDKVTYVMDAEKLFQLLNSSEDNSTSEAA